ncbi:hypothetical protein [Streptomyces sp. VNUA24]|uniref:hypothetical protein n=1 Tax=Streptomyces sp. VNUA24 TaxID=3031131 RepID=UPI0023B7F559|nr:hypothetical protein [Streptomyces sp. VNUA24]WEH15572.1 hypothetical protein PYR72_18340 [Streptomyces sp. VNUA24]
MPLDPPADPFEESLADALRRAGDGFDSEGHTLVDGGAARGRRRLFRRRAAMLGGVAGIALVAVGGTVLLPGAGSGGGKQSVAAERSGGPDVRDDDGKVSGAQLVERLRDLLPAGKVGGESARGTGAGPGPYARLVYDDGEGAATVELTLGRVDPDSEQARQLTACPAEAAVRYDSCTESTRPDGSRLTLFQGYEYPDRRADTKLWYAQLVHPDGYEVGVMEWNAKAQKDAPVTRAEPPLPLSSLRSIVTEPQWGEVVGAIPKDAGRKPSSTERPRTDPVDAPTVDGLAIRKTLLGLLPEGVDTVEEGNQESDSAYVVVDDGKGKSLVQVNVQPGMTDVGHSLFGADAETLPDGTKVATRQGPGEKGGEGVVMWTVDTLRTDGLRVVISAFNSGAQHTAATRKTPALTLAQLKEIATAERWRSLG